jgi:SOS response regulatory protein OraA/RecX
MSPEITKIDKARGFDRLMDVHLAGELWLPLVEDIVLKFGLCNGLQLNEDQQAEIEQANERLFARNRLHRYVAKALRSRRQASLHLKRSKLKLQPDVIETTLSEFEQLGLLNDEVYANAFVRSKKRLKLVGPRKLKADLASNGIGYELADEAIDANRGIDFQGISKQRKKKNDVLDSEDESERLDDKELQSEECVRLLQKYERRWVKEEDRKKRRNKAMRFLMNRGYEPEPIFRALDMMQWGGADPFDD